MTYTANPFYAARRATGRAAEAKRRQRVLGPDDRPDADWTCRPCWYVVAETGERRIWLAGPFRTQDEAAAASPRAALWAVFRSGDEHAGSYQYHVHLHGHGRRASVLGREVN